MKPLHRVLPSLALLLTGVASQAPHSTEQAEPSTGWSPGEQLGSVTIHRDQWGVPHIFADLEEDGFYGLGYAQAEDQLELILRLFLAGRGELAAAYGDETSTPVADWVAVDARSRLWRHAEEGRAGWERLTPQLQRNYEHYVAGLEAWMVEHPDRTPDWAPDLEPWDPVVLSRYVFWANYQAGQGLQDCSRGGVQLSAVDAASVEQAARAASNAWVLAPWRTRAGAAIVLSDPHGEINGAAFYESRLHAGELEAAGFSFGPLLILTHTRDVSWGMTTGAPDVADCYEIEVDPADSLRYRYDGEWRRMETREVTIAVRGAEPVVRTLVYTLHRGVLSPIVAWQDEHAYAVRTAYMHTAGDFDQEVYEINRATDIAEVKQAMRRLGMFPQNVMFGDRHGDSWYVRAGRTPVRPDGFNWNRPVPGNTSETMWRGIHPLEDLVQLETPAAGYMQNNNVSPDVMLEESPLMPDRYPEYIYNDRRARQNTRSLRAVEVLSTADDFTLEDAIDLALDEKWFGTEAWLEALREALDEEADRVRAAAPETRELARRILGFDGHARQESRAAHAYLAWREALYTLPDLELRERVALSDPLWRRDGVRREHLTRLIEALEVAVDTMQARYGSIDRTLGEIFRIRRGDESWPLGGMSILRPGSQGGCAAPLRCVFTLRAMTPVSPIDSLGVRYAGRGSRVLRLVQFTDPLRSFTLHNYGQSQDVESAHYADQARLTSQRRLKPTYFEPAQLMDNVVSTTVLEVRVP